MNLVRLIKIFIASPGDVNIQRDEVERLIWDWNAEHVDSKGTILMPVRWENNSSPSFKVNSSGQEVINHQIVKSSDILIAIFGNKIGTKTPRGKSGTVEEINVFYEEHKDRVGIFFVEGNVPVDLLDEHKMVMRYKQYLSNNNHGLYSSYDINNIRRFITREVDKLISNNSDYKEAENNIENNLNLNIFDSLEYDDDERLFVIHAVENSIRDFGDRWMSGHTLREIEKWERENNLSEYLSNRYTSVLQKLFDRKLLYVKEYTSEGNPRLYGVEVEIYKKLKKVILESNEQIEQIKQKFEKKEDLNKNQDLDLPF